MASFYGGPKGQSFDIVRTYQTVMLMRQDFLSPRCSVPIGSYVSIIETGEIYKRTQNFSEETGGAFLVGAFKGANGTPANIKFVPFDDITVTDLTEFPLNGNTITGTAENPVTSIPVKMETQEQDGFMQTNIALKLPYKNIEFEWNNAPTSDGRIHIDPDSESQSELYTKYIVTVPAALNNINIDKFYYVENRDAWRTYCGEPEVPIYKNTDDNPLVPLSTDTEFENILIYRVNYGGDTPSKWFKLCNYFINDLTFDDTHRQFILTNNGITTEIPLHELTKITLDPAGIMKGVLNGEEVTLTDQNSVIRWITNISGDQDGLITITYNTKSDGEHFDTQTFSEPVYSIKDVNLTDRGYLTIIYTKKIDAFAEKTETIYNPKTEGLYELNTVDKPLYLEIVNTATSQNEYNAAVDLYVQRWGKIDETLFVASQDESPQEIRENSGIIKKYYYKTGQQVNEEETFGPIRSINSITQNGNAVTISYNTGETTPLVLPDPNSISSIEVDNNAHELIIHFTNGTSSTFDWPEPASPISGFGIDVDRAYIVLENGQIFTSNQTITYPEYLFLDSDQRLKYVTNSNLVYAEVQDTTGKNPKEEYWYEKRETPVIYYVLTQDTEVDQSKTYYEKQILDNGNRAIHTITDEPLNSIRKVTVHDAELLIQYTDPAKMVNTKEYDNEQWVSLGDIKDNSGICIDYWISPSIDSTAYGSIDATIATLNTDFPNGYNGNPHSCIAVGASQMSKRIYGYDANNHTWTYIGSSFTPAENIIAVNSADNENEPNVQNLPAGGLWFISEEAEDIYDERPEIFGTYWEYPDRPEEWD